MILIDGVPGSLTNLNAYDIESVSVLKDAASASIYGARAANGVILVTTKTGKENELKVNYQINLAVHTPTRLLDLVTNSADYMRLYNEAKTNSGIASSTTTYPDDVISMYENATDRNQYPNFDWQNYMFNSALVQTHNLSLSGGSKTTTYNIGLGYVNQPGTMRGFQFEKYMFRTNIRSQMKDWITIGSNLALERGDRIQPQNGQEDAYLSTLAQPPTYGPSLPDGSGRYTYKAYAHEYNNKNMGAIIGNNANNGIIAYDISGQLWAEVKLFKGLNWYTKGAINFTDNTQKVWRPKVPLYNYHTGDYSADLDVGTIGLTVTNSRTWYTNLFSYLKYDTSIAQNHNIGLQVGYSQETNRYDNLQGYRQEFFSELYELNAGASSLQTNSGYAYQWAILSYFGRLNYDYMGRYLFEVNARYDGTSRFHEDYRWGLFPSFSAGWRITEEDFIKNLNFTWLNNLKFRGSYGLLGNQNVSVSSRPYPSQSSLSYTGNYPFDNSNLSTGVAGTSFTNEAIQWEATSVFDIGVDITIFRGLSLTYDYYKRNTTDILRNAQVSAMLGLSAPVVNAGAMVNYGHEVSVRYDGYVSDGSLKGLNYGGGIFFNKNKNEASNFGVDEISGNYIYRNGVPYGSYYLLDWIGIFQTEEEIANSPRQFSDNVRPGDLKYRDTNNDGVINNDDRIVIDGRHPKFEYSFNLYANWKGFDLSAFFQGVNGRKFYVNSWGYQAFRQGAVPTKEWLTDRWTGPGTSNTLPRITFNETGDSQNRRGNTWFLQNATYLRLKNLTLGYSLPKNIISKIRCEEVRIYFSGDNLALFSNYKYLDPERAGDGNFAQYPANRIVSFGLNVEF